MGEGERKDWLKLGKFLGHPVVRTPCFQCSGPGFHSWLGNEDPTSCAVLTKKKKVIKAQKCLDLVVVPFTNTDMKLG